MKACELEIARMTKEVIRAKKQNDKISDNEIIIKIAAELAGNNIERQDEIEKKLQELISENTNTIDNEYQTNIRDFFLINQNYERNIYNQVRNKVRQLLMNIVFNGSDSVSTSNQLHNAFIQLINKSRREASGNSSVNINYDIIRKYINNTLTNEDKSNYFHQNNIDNIVTFLIATNLPILINTWFQGIFKYNYSTNTYEFAIESKVRKDWYDNPDEKEAELNGFMTLFCKSTRMVKVTEMDENNKKIETLDYKVITKNSFFYAINSILKNINSNDYIEFLKNPYSLIDFLIDKYKKENPISLEDNIIFSLLNQWFFDFETYWNNSNDSNSISKYYRNFYKNQLKTNSNFGFNFLDIFIKNLNKFTGNQFIEYDVTGSDTTLESNASQNNEIYMRTLDNIDDTLNYIVDDKNSLIQFINDKYQLVNIAKEFNKDDSDKLYIFVKQVLNIDELTVIDESQYKNYYNFINALVDYLNSPQYDSLDDYIKNKKSNLKEFSLREFISSKIKDIIKYNPFILKGTQPNKLNKQLPTVGLQSVAKGLNEEIYRNRIEVETLKRNGIISPIAHTKLYAQTNNTDQEPLFVRTIARTTLSANITENGKTKTETKSTKNLSSPEQYSLMLLNDFFNNFKQGGKIRIEAITPSDKPDIPYFEFNVDTINKLYYDENTKEYETKIILEFQSVYGQYLLNTINVFNKILGNEEGAYKNIADIKGNKWFYLITAVNTINNQIKNLSETDLQIKVHKYNKDNNTNLILANYHDYIIKNNQVYVSPHLVATTSLFFNENPFDNFYKQFLNDLPNITIQIGEKSYINIIDLKENFEQAKKSQLYNFFLIKNVLSLEVLTNTMGLAISHKFKLKNETDAIIGNWFELKNDHWVLTENALNKLESINSQAHITMTKRASVLTTTMHACIPNALTGLARETRTMTIKNDVQKMFSYSGNSTEGNTSQADLETNDGILLMPYFATVLTKQSITDVKPHGMDMKLVWHNLNVEKGGSFFIKMAGNTIDNNMLRLFSDDNISEVGGVDLMDFMKLSLQEAVINESSINDKGKLINYNKRNVCFNTIYFKKDNKIYKVLPSTIKYNQNENTWMYNIEGETEPRSCKNNLFDFWKNILGGEWSCTKDGIYDNSSQDNLVILLNSIGNKYSDETVVRTQNDVDQYLKKQVITHFPTQSTQKALQAPAVDIREAIKNEEYRWTTKLNIEHLGVQQDTDHEATNTTIREITQLISFITENGYVPEQVNEIYSGLAKLVQILANKTYIDPSILVDENERKKYRDRLNSIFGPRLHRILTSSVESAIGLANIIAEEIDAYNKQINDKLNPVYSDNQLIGKFHTTVGSYLNKFISRTWNGRADVLIASYNWCMLYEDENGVTYFKNDLHYSKNENGKWESQPIKEYLSNLVWNDESKTTFKQEFIDKYKITNGYELMPGDTLYKVELSGEGVYYKLATIVIDSWEKLQSVKKEIIKYPNQIRYVKSLDLPRNLRSKRIWLDVTTDDGNTVSVGLYHLNTLNKIISIDQEIEKEENNIKSTQDEIDQFRITKLAQKDELKLKWEDEILQSIKNKDIEKLKDELPEHLKNQNIVKIKYRLINDERITTNGYNKKFGIADMNFSEIAQKKEDYFKQKLNDQKENFNKSIEDNIDYVFYSRNGKATKILLKDDSNQNNNNLIEYTHVTVVVDEDGYRIDDDGNQIYKWPKNAQLYINSNDKNSEIIICTKEELDILLQNHSFLFYKTDEKNKKELQKYKNIFDIEHFDSQIDYIAKFQYETWLKTNVSVSARIPSQSLAFAMVMNTVGYLPFNINVSMVPNMHVWLQGSDYDIDKIYTIMVDIDENGIYKNFNSESLTLIKNLEFDDLTQNEQNIHEKLANILDKNWNNIDKLNSNDILGQLKPYLSTNIRINKDIIYNFLLVIDSYDSSFQNIYINHIDYNEFNKKFNILYNKINDTISYLDNTRKDIKAIQQNYLLDLIINIYDDPRTLVATTTPTTMYPINSIVKQLNLESEKRCSFNPATDINLNQSNSVGKIDIGIGANGQKANYAITYYYLQKYINKESTINPKLIKLPKDWQINGIKEIFSLGFAGTRLNEAGCNALEEWITSGRLVSKYDIIHVNETLTIYRKNTLTIVIDTNAKDKGLKSWPEIYIGHLTDNNYEKIIKNNNFAQLKQYLKYYKPGDRLSRIIAASIISSLISSATDNAKEMKLDLINASPEILPAYIYLITLGVSMHQAVKILTDSILKDAIIWARGNLFNNKIGLKRISTVLKNDDFIKQYNNDKEKIELLKSIFIGADELTSIATALSINGGIDVLIGDPILYQLKFEQNIDRLTDSKDISKFHLEYFINNNQVYQEEWINKIEDKKQSYNILDILRSVPHFYEMIKVPIQFKNIVTTLSKDIDITYNLILKQLKFNYKITDKTIRNLVRVVNHRKCYTFIKSLNLQYTPKLLYAYYKDNQKIESVNNPINNENNLALSTNSDIGIINLKMFIEDEIIRPLKTNPKEFFEQYQNENSKSYKGIDFNKNTFIRNLDYNKNFFGLHLFKAEAYASKINLSDLQNEDQIAMIKTDFDKLKNFKIKGQTLFNWLFLYDTLVYTRELNRNSFGLLFDNSINLNDNDNLLTKWIKFINYYDESNIQYDALKEALLMPGLEFKIAKTFKEDEAEVNYEYVDGTELVSRKPSLPTGIINPKILPLFVNVKEYEKTELLNSNLFTEAFQKQIIRAFLC